jgi:hypothetical protein
MKIRAIGSTSPMKVRKKKVRNSPNINSGATPKPSGTEDNAMEHQFYTLFDFLVYTKFAAYILMGLTLLGFLGFWLFLTGRDEDKEIH